MIPALRGSAFHYNQAIAPLSTPEPSSTAGLTCHGLSLKISAGALCGPEEESALPWRTAHPPRG
jgi:hypothetical protein